VRAAGIAEVTFVSETVLLRQASALAGSDQDAGDLSRSRLQAGLTDCLAHFCDLALLALSYTLADIGLTEGLGHCSWISAVGEIAAALHAITNRQWRGSRC
jgi:hypothetical protein